MFEVLNFTVSDEVFLHKSPAATPDGSDEAPAKFNPEFVLLAWNVCVFPAVYVFGLSFTTMFVPVAMLVTPVDGTVLTVWLLPDP